MEHAIGDCLQALGVFGGIALIILASSKAKLDRIKTERALWQQPVAHIQPSAQTDPVLTELQALKQQINQMQGTSHQFDISFDAALGRLEQRVANVESKTATVPVAPAIPAEPQVLRNGHQL